MGTYKRDYKKMYAYYKKNYKNISFKLSYDKDKDILDYLSSKDNVASTIREVLREKINEE